MEKFEEEIRRIFDEKFMEKTRNLKKSGHIFDPVFYLFFTRLVELSTILKGIILPNEYELKELFDLRRDLLQIDYKTLNELLRKAWVYERKHGIDSGLNENPEDMLYLIYRMGKIQREIDEAIMRNVEWRKERLIEIYFELLRILIEIENEINRSIKLES